MANLCFISTDIICSSPADKIKILAGIASNTDKDKSINFSNTNVIMDSYINDTGNSTLYIGGAVKWVLQVEEMKDFIRLIQSFGKVKSVKTSYEEVSSSIFGNYTYAAKGQTLVDHYIPIKKFPDKRHLVHSYLVKHGVTEQYLIA